MSESSQFLWIPGKLPGLNEVIDAAHKVYGYGKARSSEYRKMKRAWGERVQVYARQQGFRPVESACFVYLCVETARTRDPSNVVAGAMKLIEDGLQDAELLTNDGWKNILSLQVFWTLGPEPGVMVACGVPAPSLGELRERVPGLTAGR